MGQLILNECVYGCVQGEGSPETPNIKIEHGLCKKCGEDQRGKKCMHLVDDHDKLSDGYCNNTAAMKYSKKVLGNGASVKRCRLHYYMDCCDEAHEKIADLERELRELDGEPDVAVVADPGIGELPPEEEVELHGSPITADDTIPICDSPEHPHGCGCDQKKLASATTDSMENLEHPPDSMGHKWGVIASAYVHEPMSSTSFPPPGINIGQMYCRHCHSILGAGRSMVVSADPLGQAAAVGDGGGPSGGIIVSEFGQSVNHVTGHLKFHGVNKADQTTVQGPKEPLLPPVEHSWELIPGVGRICRLCDSSYTMNKPYCNRDSHD